MAMAAAPSATEHDLESRDRIVAVRDFLDAFATGSLIPTTGSLANLAGVLVSAARHQKIADAERQVAA